MVVVGWGIEWESTLSKMLKFKLIPKKTQAVSLRVKKNNIGISAHKSAMKKRKTYTLQVLMRAS